MLMQIIKDIQEAIRQSLFWQVLESAVLHAVR